MSQPWGRQIETKIWNIAEWRSGRPAGKAGIRVFSDGTPDTLRSSFSIEHHRGANSWPSQVNIYNLGVDLRNALQTLDAVIEVNVGWENIGLQTMFKGSITGAWSDRQGRDIVTSLHCLSAPGALWRTVVDPAIDRDKDKHFWPGGTPLQTVVMELAAKFPEVQVSTSQVKVPDKVIAPRGYSATGLVRACLIDLGRIYGFTWSVNNGKFYATKDILESTGDFASTIVNIDAENGFLLRAEPTLYNDSKQFGGVVISSLLNPLINVESIINLKTTINPKLNNTSWRVWQVTHQGDTHSNQWNTTAEASIFSN